jgi:hypothetical protein
LGESELLAKLVPEVNGSCSTAPVISKIRWTAYRPGTIASCQSSSAINEIPAPRNDNKPTAAPHSRSKADGRSPSISAIAASTALSRSVGAHPTLARCNCPLSETTRSAPVGRPAPSLVTV